jgi:hypothetical protein
MLSQDEIIELTRRTLGRWRRLDNFDAAFRQLQHIRRIRHLQLKSTNNEPRKHTI